MTLELFLGLLVFAGVASFTPGPNNALLMASGMNFGFRRTLPLVVGVTIGFPVMIALIGLGLGRVFEQYPIIYQGLKYAGAAYMLFLAWKIAFAKPASSEAEAAKPLSFLQMCIFQWVNPKGWVMAVTALSAYTLASHYYVGLVTVVLVFFLTGIGSSVTWVAFGSALKGFMTDARYFRIINVVLALLLVASLVPMLRH